LTLFHHKYRIETARLKGWDYSKPGAYFVTAVTKDRECIFGRIESGEMICNDAGSIANKCWSDIPAHFPNVILDSYIVMPNHVHGIIFITEQNIGSNITAQNFASPPPDITETGMTDNSSDKIAAEVIVDTQNHNVETQNFASLQNIKTLYQNQPIPYKNKFGPQSKNLASIVRGFKIGVTNWFRNNNFNGTIWQPRFHDHIIRDYETLEKIRNYILHNPETWREDKFYNE
jgi:putative transposase